MKQLRLRRVQGYKPVGALLIQTQDSQTPVLLPTTLGCPLAILAPSSQPRRTLVPLASRAWASDLPELGRCMSGEAPLLVPWDSGKRLNQED